MSDCMDYPQTLRKFANDYSFKDREEVYTNGSMLVPLFRIEQALDEHFMDIEKVQYKMDTDSAYECGYQQGRADAIDEFLEMIKPCNNCPSYPNECNDIDYFEDCCRTEQSISWEDLRIKAEQLKENNKCN